MSQRCLLAVLAVALLGLGAASVAEACQCGGCPPTSCGETSAVSPGTGLLAVRTTGQRGPLLAYDVATGRRRFSLPAGVLAAGGTRFVATRGTADGKATLVQSFDARRGRLLSSRRYGGRNWFVGGVSANGRVIALVRQVPHLTRVALVGSRGRTLQELTFHGWFDVDAVSNDARRVFLVQYLRNGGYLIRRFDAAQRSLASDVLTEKGKPMQGVAWDAVASPDGRRLMTLYLRGNRPEVHTLDLVRGTAVCIDLPGGDAWSEQQYTLALSPDARTLYAANPALGIVATIDLPKLRVVRVVHFLVDPESAGLAPSAVTSHDRRTVYFTAGRLLFAYDAAYRRVRGPYDLGTGIAGIAFGAGDRTLLVVTHAGRALRLDAATGRRLR